MLTDKFSKGESCVFTPQVEPIPLFGELRVSEAVPWESLGPLGDAIRAISTRT